MYKIYSIKLKNVFLFDKKVYNGDNWISRDFKSIFYNLNRYVSNVKKFNVSKFLCLKLLQSDLKFNHIICGFQS